MSGEKPGGKEQQSQPKTHYEVLGVAKNATPKKIKEAFKQLALKYHPDKNLDNQEWAHEKFAEVANAYSVLSNPTQRGEYDRSLNSRRKTGKRMSADVNPLESFYTGDPRAFFDFVNNFFGFSNYNDLFNQSDASHAATEQLIKQAIRNAEPSKPPSQNREKSQSGNPLDTNQTDPEATNRGTADTTEVDPAEKTQSPSLDDILAAIGVDADQAIENGQPTQREPSEIDVILEQFEKPNEEPTEPENSSEEDSSDPVIAQAKENETLSIKEEKEDDSEELTFTLKDSEPESQSEKERLEQKLNEILAKLKTETPYQIFGITPATSDPDGLAGKRILDEAGAKFIALTKDENFKDYLKQGLKDKASSVQRGYDRALKEIIEGRGDQVLGWEFDNAGVTEVDDDQLERLDEELDTALHGEAGVYSEEDLDILLAHLEESTINQIFGVGEADETPKEILDGLLLALNPDDYDDFLKDKVRLLKDGLKKAYKEYQAGNGDKVLGLEFKSTSQASETVDGEETFDQFLNRLSQMIDGVKKEIHQAGEDNKIRRRYKEIKSKIAEIKILINEKTLETTSPDRLKLLESREKVLTDHEKQLELLYAKLPSRRAQFRRVVVRGLLGLGAIGIGSALLFGGGGSDSDSSSYEGKDPSLAKSVPPTAAAEDLRGETKESTRIERSDLNIPAKEINNTTQFEAPNGATIATFEMNINVISADYDTQGNAVFEVEDVVSQDKWRLVFTPPEDPNATGNNADWKLISQELINQ